MDLKVKPPSKATLKKYGLTLEDWTEHLNRQGGVCGCCKAIPKTERLCIDHEHVYRWKKKPPEERKLFIRGLLCWWCNSRFLSRGATEEKLRNGADYLAAYQSRKLPTE